MEFLVKVIQNARHSCFHIATTWTNTDLENAKAVCSQAVLHRSGEGDASLYFAVCDSRTQIVHFCLCDPSLQTIEDVSSYSMQSEAGRVVEWLKIYIDSNTKILC